MTESNVENETLRQRCRIDKFDTERQNVKKGVEGVTINEILIFTHLHAIFRRFHRIKRSPYYKKCERIDDMEPKNSYR